MKAAVIYNQEAGKPGYSPEKLCELLGNEISSDLFSINSNNINEILEKIRWENYDVIVAVGGDGTISTVAENAVKFKMKFGIIPAGTLNHFAKDLGIPADPEKAVEIIKNGKTKLIDTAEINEFLFLNNSSIGVYPEVVKRKNKEIKPGGNKWIAMIKAARVVFKSMQILEVEIKSDEKAVKCKTPFVFVGNNEYKMDLFNLGKRDGLDKGELWIYYLNYKGRISYLRLLFKALVGGLNQEENFIILHSQSIRISSKKRRFSVSLDGEVMKIKTPLNYRINPESLNIFVP